MAILTPGKLLRVTNDYPGQLEAARAEALHKSPPRYLHHYTDVRGLIGIVKEGCLWATNSLYCNDASEGAYSLEILERAIDAKLRKSKHEAVRAVIEPLKGRWLTKNYACYVACFCKNGNELNQWRVYAPNEGYSLRFNTSELLRYQERVHVRHRFALMRVLYDEKEQLDLVGELLNITAKYVAKHFPNTDEGADKAVVLTTYLYMPLFRLLLAFKHPEFKAEQEWRLVCAETGHLGYTKFRPGRYGLTPYIEYRPPSLDPKKPRRLPISAVLRGPAANPDTAGYALAALMDTYGFRDVDVEVSSLPIR